jgi:two-component system chemotaxis response regulator CheB
MDGLEVMRKLQSDGNRIPIIAISASVKEDRDLTVKAFELGAVEFVVRPFHLSADERDAFTGELKDALNAATKSNTAVLNKQASAAQPKPSPVKPTANITPMAAKPEGSIPGKFDLLAIASSTGGPQALRTFIPMLPKHIGVPGVIVQHMPKGFTASLAERISETSNLVMKEAEDNEVLKNDVIYIAPGGKHLEIKMNSSGKMVSVLSDAPAVNNLKPCADVTFRTIANLSIKSVLCVVLTGMGSDGTEGIKAIRATKNTYCITQSADTCVVYGMPKAADLAGLSNESAPITEVADRVARKLGV